MTGLPTGSGLSSNLHLLPGFYSGLTISFRSGLDKAEQCHPGLSCLDRLPAESVGEPSRIQPLYSLEPEEQYQGKMANLR